MVGQEKMYTFDKKFMKRLLQRDPQTRDEALTEMYQDILMQYVTGSYTPVFLILRLRVRKAVPKNTVKKRRE